MLRSSFAAFALAILSSAALAARSPAEAVQGFYSARIQSGSVGVPTGAELMKFSSFLAPEMVCLLSASLRYNDQFAKAKPFDKAPLAEGDLYSSSPATPTRFIAGAPEVSGGKASVRVRFYRESAGAAEGAEGADSASWEDVAHVTQIRGKWLISDVEYLDATRGSKQGSLMQLLRDTLSHPDPAAGWNVRELSSCSLGAQPAAAPAKSASAKKGVVKKGVAKKGSKAAAQPTRRTASASKATPAKSSAKTSSAKASAKTTTKKKTH